MRVQGACLALNMRLQGACFKTGAGVTFEPEASSSERLGFSRVAA